MLRSRVPPLRLQAGAARGRYHNGLLVTSDLREMTATRPVTTPNLHCAPPCAKPADHHDTPHRDGRLFNAAQKKRTATRPQTAHRGQGPIATTRATCDVRAELRLVHWAWRGRGSPAPLEHDGGLGSYFFPSVEGRHRPLRSRCFCSFFRFAFFIFPDFSAVLHFSCPRFHFAFLHRPRPRACALSHQKNNQQFTRSRGQWVDPLERWRGVGGSCARARYRSIPICWFGVSRIDKPGDSDATSLRSL